MKQMFEKLCMWVAKYIIPLFFTLGFLITLLGGFIPLFLFYNAPNYSFQPNFSGFGVARNETNISPNFFVLSITIRPPELYFYYSFSCCENGTYNFLFWFPFKIISKTSSTMNMSFNATSRGSAVWLRYQVDNVGYGWVNHQFSGVFSIENTFQSGTRGSYMFVLPFGLGIPGELIWNIQRELKVPFTTTSANIDLSFGVPSGYHITQTFPPHTVGPNTWTTRSNRTITKVGWNPRDLRDSVTIYCQNPNEIALYQSFLFIGGLCLGIGFPIMTTPVYDTVKKWTKPRQNEDRYVRFGKRHFIIVGITILVVIGILEAYGFRMLEFVSLSMHKLEDAFPGAFGAVLTAIAAIIGFVGGRYIYDEIRKPQLEILRTDQLSVGVDRWWRIIVKNKGLTGAENCTGLIHLSGFDSGRRPIEQRGGVCWSTLGNPSTITLNVEDEQSLDIYRVHQHGQQYRFQIPTEKGWGIPRYTIVLNHLVKPAELLLKVRITAKNAKPIDKTYTLEVQSGNVIPRPTC